MNRRAIAILTLALASAATASPKAVFLRQGVVTVSQPKDCPCWTCRPTVGPVVYLGRHGTVTLGDPTKAPTGPGVTRR